MNKNQIKGLINDLLSLNDANNPLDYFDNLEDLEIDLLKKTINYPKKDELYDFYTYKMEWFNKRIDQLNAKSEFNSGKIKVSEKLETAELKFNNETFVGEFQHRKYSIPAKLSGGKKLKGHIKQI